LRKKNNLVNIHIIGIGGIGMSAIAEVLIQLGFKVQGSDMNESPNVEKLRRLGAKVTIGHSAENVAGATVVTHSSAVKKDNPEFKYASDEGLPLLRRAEILADIMKLKQGIAIAGTHGKTTTTSIVSTLLKEMGADPTYIIGGIVHNLGGHAYVGEGDYVVAEADESDGSFLMLSPIASIITNIDNDHLDHYGSEEGLEIAFNTFANTVPFFGVCSLNIHDEKLRKIKSEMKKPFVTFGVEEVPEPVDYRAKELLQSPEGAEFTLEVSGVEAGRFKLKLPGRHNVLNALGAISICIELGFDVDEIKRALETFEGVGRRFQKIYEKGGVEVIDDYGHHPTEIYETIQTAKLSRPDKEIRVVFEPHRFTRTRDCWQQFLHCFNHADKVLMAPVYSANEKPIKGITTDALVGDINKLHPGLATHFKSWSEVEEDIKKNLDKKVLYLALGAGSVGKKVKEIVSNFE